MSAAPIVAGNAATARAFPNIALVKYWGKRDESLIIPAAGSLSLTLDVFPTTTTVGLAPENAGSPVGAAASAASIDGRDSPASADIFELNGAPASDEALRRVTRFLDHVRARAGSERRAIVRSRNEAPTGAGLASSAAGFAALATAAAAAYGLDLDRPGLSRLARRGSGSASRSIVPGVAVWHAGHGDESSFAEAISAPEMRMVLVTVDGGQKAVSSRAAMRRTAITSPFYPAWVRSTEVSLDAMIEACRVGDFTRIGEITESHALRMHAVIQSAEPPIRYLRPRSIAVFDAIAELRAGGVEAYATADAGPNVVALVRPRDAEVVAEALAGLGGVRVAAPGPGAALVPTPLSSTPLSSPQLPSAQLLSAEVAS
ncbi:MAG: diphosphomevalonate decarboxylase [Leucobacter sp.]